MPLGGYVRFAGDENAASVPDQNDLEAMRRDLMAREGEAALGRYFHFKPLWQRALHHRRRAGRQLPAGDRRSSPSCS